MKTPKIPFFQFFSREVYVIYNNCSMEHNAKLLTPFLSIDFSPFPPYPLCPPAPDNHLYIFNFSEMTCILGSIGETM